MQTSLVESQSRRGRVARAESAGNQVPPRSQLPPVPLTRAPRLRPRSFGDLVAGPARAALCGFHPPSHQGQCRLDDYYNFVDHERQVWNPCVLQFAEGSRSMKETASGVGLVVLAVLCCAGLPLLVVAGASVGAAAVLGGVGTAAGVAALAFVILLIRRRRRTARASREDAHPTRPSKALG